MNGGARSPRAGSRTAGKPAKSGNTIMYIIYETYRDSGPLRHDPMVDWGWDAFFAGAFAALGLSNEELSAPGTFPTARRVAANGLEESEPNDSARSLGALERARVLEVNRGSWLVIRTDETGAAIEDRAVLSGRARLHMDSGADAPAVGDWVVGRKETGGPFIIEGLLPRKSAFIRKAPGDTAHDRVASQVIAANIDVAFLIAAAGEDFSARRLERYAALAEEAGVRPVVVVAKADLAGDDILDLVAQASAACPSAPAFAVCALEGRGLAAFSEYLKPGLTAVLLGSSGAGKSTILNALAGTELAYTGEVRAFDQRGRHTTTARTLHRLPTGAMIIDTPGLREVQLWATLESVDAIFSEIEEAAQACRFSDCSHRTEPGCAVLAARESGAISEERYQSWLKMRKEIAFVDTRRVVSARLAEKAKLKQRGKLIHELERSRR
ncbi:MAG: ribosome small subunit-dependent GTPase A [Spirochaetales bacterium]|nr:MAG: ribosome small subunit-dependent GTPase A [Spirochaetales bacterium]